MTDTVPTLKLEDLHVEYSVRGRARKVLHGIDLEIGRGECYGLVGESGCGKSTAAYAVLRYLPRNGSAPRGRVLVNGEDLLGLDGARLRELRRRSLAMVYQDPGKALNPSVRIGRQVEEVFELLGLPKAARRQRTVEILRKVRIADPANVMERYPHQLSGGMQQRVAIAMALASEPSLLVLDEPTTGLDATVEADVLDLIVQLRKELDTSILFISHNLGVIARMCDRVGVLYAGRLVEQGHTSEIFRNPRHPYTVGLLRCLPQRGRSKAVAPLVTIPGFLPTAGTDATGCVFAERCPLAEERCRRDDPPAYDVGEDHFSRCHYHDRTAALTFDNEIAETGAGAASDRRILELSGVSKTFGRGKTTFRALNEVSIDVMEGETLGIVGESGSGKTTLARAVLGIVPADEGSTIRLDGNAMEPMLKHRAQAQVKALQIVFQNPDSALNRSHTVRRMIGRTIGLLTGLAGAAKSSRIVELTRAVRLSDRYLDLRPRNLSGGLKQRVAIARAFSGDPRVVVLDEPTSALDVSVQAAILNLLVELQTSKKVSYVFISHDLGVVRYLSDRIAVLYLGRLMEIGAAEDVFSGPHHPYTEALLSSVPSVDGVQRERVKLDGEIPSAMNPPAGCVFHTRCVRKIGRICETVQPPLNDVGAGHLVRCHIPADKLPRAAETVSVAG